MVEALSEQMSGLQEIGEPIALIGPKPVSSFLEHKPPKVHWHANERCIAGVKAVLFAISSGSLIEVESFQEIGPF